MKRRSNPSFVLVLACLLVFAQQAAVAHLIGHLGAAAQEQVQPDNDSGHSAAESLTHVCTTCLAFTAMDAAVAPQVHLPTPVVTAAPAVLPWFFSVVSARFESRYLSRAPPVLI